MIFISVDAKLRVVSLVSTSSMIISTEEKIRGPNHIIHTSNAMFSSGDCGIDPLVT